MATPIVSLHPLPLSIATPSRDSMTFTSTKGLLNGPGQNNCFLNSAVQVLWHLDIFRRSFRDLSGHACMAESCIFCALKELFSQLQFSNETALPPDALRRALAESFFDQQRFQLGFMDDAAECFENMLMRIHMHIAHNEAEDMCNARHCIPHQKFAMTLVEQSVCKACGATSEPLSYTQMVHYVSTSTLVYQFRTTRAQGILEPFGQLLRKAGSMGDVRACPSSCNAVIQIGRTLINRPEIVSIGLVWNSERPTLDHIMEVFSTIGTTLRLGDVFNTVVDQRWAETSVHNLVGVVTYYGKHYSTFFFHTKLRIWIYFDDATVREVGPRWEQVVEKCRKGRYQPLLLLYALPDGTPVNTDSAPKNVVPFYPRKSLLRRAITPSPEKPNIPGTRRAITPNPPLRSYNEYQNLAVIQSSIYKGVDCVDGADVRAQKPLNIHRTLSNGSSDGSYREYLNLPRTRDSGNWSSDRNSASSSSSTTMEAPYTSSGNYDVGYDSYSLSSNDSSTMTTIQHLMKMGHLAKIPEDYNPPAQVSQSCDVLCDEADELLVKSRQLEDDHDLVLALALCNAAATKARAAMDAPYNNPQTLTLARMKHNTCIMRARSLHRRMTQSSSTGKEAPMEIRHTREGSSSSKHSREKVPGPPAKNIEIYATLPKKKPTEEVVYDKPPIERESRGLFSRKPREKRSRSEDRNKVPKDLSIAPEIKPEEKKKKQHKIRRKLLMGGLIKRKNRSMPDLTDASEETPSTATTSTSLDDSSISCKTPVDTSGYLSEGHEFSTRNPTLERSKLMRKSFHSSAGKMLTVAKVPPPPPLRTTSQLSKNCTSTRAGVDEVDGLPPYPIASKLHPRTLQFNKTRADTDEVDGLPPYPSPIGSVIHSRQASEEFPPPPPPLDTVHDPSTLLAQLQLLAAPSVKDLASKFNGVIVPTLAPDDMIKKNKLGKKKSVSFCDQVTLVATAEEQEDDSYIPNPILERVLRSAMNKPETAAIRQEVLEKQESLYVRRNSYENLLEPQYADQPGLPEPGYYNYNGAQPQYYQYRRTPVYQPPPYYYQPEYYQRVPPPHPAYPKAQPAVNYDGGTKGSEVPIIVNNANKTKCNLCRKKVVVAANLYCTDCEFYMSRFKPKR